MTEKKEQVLPEAPASVNFKGVTKAGFICQWTLRDADENVLLERQVVFMQLLVEGGVVPYPATRQPDAPAVSPDDPSYCKIHNEQMKEWEKEGRVWYSHKVGEDWCKGK